MEKQFSRYWLSGWPVILGGLLQNLELDWVRGRLPPLELMNSEDQLVIDRVLSGDSSAYESLMERYQRRLLGLLAHACGSHDEAEDLAQEAFARAFNKLHLFAGESQFYTWLCRIAMNLLATERRRKRIENQMRREGFEVTTDTVGTLGTVEKDMEKSELRQCVQDAIALLDVEKRTVLLLRDFDGMDYEAISETLEIPIGTVRSRLHRARLELKMILEQRIGQLDSYL